MGETRSSTGHRISAQVARRRRLRGPRCTRKTDTKASVEENAGEARSRLSFFPTLYPINSVSSVVNQRLNLEG